MLHQTLFPECEFSNRPFRREKVFGEGRPSPLSPGLKVRLARLMRASRRNRRVSRAHAEVFEVLLFKFHNGPSGRCFPSLAAIAKATGCAQSTVKLALRALQSLGFLTWVNRLRRAVVDGVRRVLRTSNGYQLRLPPDVEASSASMAPAWSAEAVQAGADPARCASSSAAASAAPAVDASPLEAALSRLGASVRSREVLF